MRKVFKAAVFLLTVASALAGTALLLTWRRGLSARTAPGRTETQAARAVREWFLPARYRRLRNPVACSDETLAQARAQAMGAGEIILAGGGNLYESLIGHAERMHLTFVDVAPRGAVSFPEIDWSNWLEVSRVRPRPSAKDEATFAFVDFDRRHCLSL